MTENEIAKQILDAAFVVHTKLGPGVFESVYEVVLAHELRKRGLVVERQKAMSIVYDDIQFDEAFRSDLVVNGKVVVELKPVEALSAVHAKLASDATAVERTQTRVTDQLWRGASEEWH